MKLRDFLLLDFRRVMLIGLAFIIAASLHNITCLIMKCEEFVFFSIAVFAIPLYFVSAAIYSLYYSFLNIAD